MAKYTIKSGKTTINLSKSTSLVGLKTADNKELPSDIDIKGKKMRYLGGFKVVGLDKKGTNLDEKLDSVRQHEDISVGTHVYVTEHSQKAMVPTGDIYIIFDKKTTQEAQAALLDFYKLKLKNRRNENTLVAHITPEAANPIKTAMMLEENAAVVSAEPDMDALLDNYEYVKPSDDLLPHLWHLQNTGSITDKPDWRTRRGADSRVVDAWRRLGNLGSSSVVVAVLDNGFDMTHPDLQGNVVKPYDFWTNTPTLLQGDPDFTHGTPCAGVAIGRSNGKGMIGAAPNAKFMPLSGTSYSAEATEQMFNYLIENGADIVSCSWGTTDPDFNLNTRKMEAIAKAARQGRKGKGCIICYAAGNEGKDYVNYYSAHPDVICVSACTSQDEYAEYANQGREVTICAPSNGDWPITAPRAWWDNGTPGETGNYKWWMDGVSRGDKYQHFGGTSSATPLVAGICALMLSANPDLSAKEVKSILIQTAEKIGKPSEYDSNGHSLKYGYGRVNADKAVAEAMRRKDGKVGETPKPEVKPTVSTGQGLFRFDVARQASKGFGVQIGNFASYGNVLVQVEKLKGQFQQPVLVHINELNGQTVYRIIVGAFDSVTNAIALQKSMEKAGVKGFVKDLRELV